MIRITLLLGLLIILCSSSIAYEEAELSIESESRLPLEEISGMARGKIVGQHKIFAIGDKRARIVSAYLTLRKGTLKEIKTFDFDRAAKVFFDTHGMKTENPDLLKTRLSQWEAIYRDLDNVFYLLNEQLSFILAYDKDRDQVLAMIELDGYTVAVDESKKDINHLAEGFVFMNNGHFLVAKQKNESTLIEFGLEGEKATGYGLDFFKGSQPFSLLATYPNSSIFRFKPIHIWSLEDNLKDCELNELALDTSGQLYLLSANCKWIGKVSTLNNKSKKINFDKLWNLPSQIVQPEGLAVFPEGFLVAIDSKSTNSNNLFFLRER